MADGATHEKYILIASAITFTGSVVLVNTLPVNLLIAANVGILSNVIISNDHDQDGATLPELRTAQLLTLILPKSPLKAWLQDKILRLVKIFFAPYSIWFVHRSPFTHFPVLCSIIRTFYIYFMVWWLFYRSIGFVELSTYLYQTYFNEIVFFMLFVSLGDTIHTTLDKWQLNWKIQKRT